MANAIVLATRWAQPPVRLGYVTLEPADRWLETFYADRWYNVFEIRTGDGRLKGWYCNMTRPARIDSRAVVWDDLALDVWVPPARRPSILDREEFDALPLSRSERDAARAALTALLGQIERGAGPFEQKGAEEWVNHWRSHWDGSCESAG
jgi:protein associated with RNAse G/E